MRCHQCPTAAYCDVLGGTIDGFASVVEGADPATPVPTCPGWTLADLVRHIGEIHRWAAQMVRELSPARLRREEMDAGWPDDPDGYPAWLRAGSAPLLDAFRTADPDAAMWAWGADRHVRFWPRRMVHETTVHRADAELAVGIEPAIEGGVAVDGVCELLENLPPAASFAPRVAELRGDGEELRFHATDRDVTWLVTLDPDGFRWRHPAAPGDGAGAAVTVAAPASALLLLAYRRRPADGGGEVQVDGDRALLDRWLANAAL